MGMIVSAPRLNGAHVNSEPFWTAVVGQDKLLVVADSTLESRSKRTSGVSRRTKSWD